MKVGGRDFNQDKAQVEAAMRGQEPESIQKYLVEVNGEVFPPKQVLARVTGWDRMSFTTMEAQRVLNKIGFTCRQADALPGARPGAPSESARVTRLENALATANEAIANLTRRVRALEEAAQ